MLETFAVILSLTVILAAMVGVSYLRKLAHKEEQKSYQKVAEELGFEYLGTQKAALLKPIVGHIPKVLRRSAAPLHFVMRKPVEDGVVFYFACRGNNGISPVEAGNQYFHQVALFYSEDMQLPDFYVRQKRGALYENLGYRLMHKSIDLVDYPHLSKQFLVEGSHEAAIQQLLNYQVVGCLADNAYLDVRADQNVLMCYQTNQANASTDNAMDAISPRLASLDEVKQILEDTTTLYNLLRQVPVVPR